MHVSKGMYLGAGGKMRESFNRLILAGPPCNPDRPLQNLEPQHQKFNELYVVQKRSATDFEDPKLLERL